MSTLSDGPPPQMRGPWSFMASICLHGWVLAWVVLGPSISLERQRSLYEREIQPNEKKIIWYKLTDKLPDVTPPDSRAEKRPLRAKSRLEQNMAAGPKDNAKVPQLILAPAPEIAPARPLPLPNIVALAPPPRRLIRPFVPPPEEAKPAPSTPPTLPDAPRVAVAAEPKAPPIDLKGARAIRRFTPPPAPKLPVPADPGNLPPAPELSAPEATPAGALPKMPRAFVAPPKRPTTPQEAVEITAAPPVLTSAAALPSDNSLVIAGLNPTRSVAVPAPPGTVRGGFSGGPKVQPKGSDTADTGGGLEVPSLTIQGGSKQAQPPVMVARMSSPTSPESLAAALRGARGTPAPPTGAPPRQAVRTTNAPDPRMWGRQIYTMAVQVPNLTSYSGSWLVWFAGPDPESGGPAVDMRPPLPLRMVDPKYVTAAMVERVEGKIRLWAVIGKDGTVSEVALLQHLDDRLDQSAREALGKWTFQPALRNGVPVAVDAVFEIPFYLAPKGGR